MQAMPRAGDTPPLASSNRTYLAVLSGLHLDAMMHAWDHASCSHADALCPLLQDNSYKHFSKAERRMENGVASGRSYTNFCCMTGCYSIAMIHLLILLGMPCVPVLLP